MKCIISISLILVSLLMSACVNEPVDRQEQQQMNSQQSNNVLELEDIINDLDYYNGQKITLKGYAKKSTVDHSHGGMYYAIRLYPNKNPEKTGEIWPGDDGNIGLDVYANDGGFHSKCDYVENICRKGGFTKCDLQNGREVACSIDHRDCMQKYEGCGPLKDGAEYIVRGTLQKNSDIEERVRFPTDFGLIIDSFEAN